MANHVNMAPPLLLTVAGFDPSCGAGIAADLKTFAAHGCYGVAAITSLTVQSTEGVQAVHNTPSSELREQLEILASDCAATPPSSLNFSMPTSSHTSFTTRL
jgi:hydroxymethylpyrimidine/phosphomethylpyrimidine kinase